MEVVEGFGLPGSEGGGRAVGVSGEAGVGFGVGEDGFGVGV